MAPAVTPDPFAVFSASLPLRLCPTCDPGAVGPHTVIVLGVRPWNGRALTPEEIYGAQAAADMELVRTNSPGFAAQAAFEWLSEHAR